MPEDSLAESNQRKLLFGYNAEPAQTERRKEYINFLQFVVVMCFEKPGSDLILIKVLTLWWIKPLAGHLQIAQVKKNNAKFAREIIQGLL